MPPLPNVRHEAFCQHFVTGARFGLTRGEAYIKAGYRTSGHAAEVNGSKLLKRTDIQTRIAELSAPKDVVRRVNVSAQALIDKAETLYELGVAKERDAAIGKAIELQGKLGGAMVERLEIGAPGAFTSAVTIEDIVDQMLQQLDASEALSTLDTMRSLIEQRASNQARDVTN